MSEVAHYDADDPIDLHEIIRRVLAGDEVLIDEGGRPLAKVIPLKSRDAGGDAPSEARQRVRRFGLMKGKIVAADDWDSEETNEAIARDFHESKIFPDE